MLQNYEMLSIGHRNLYVRKMYCIAASNKVFGRRLGDFLGDTWNSKFKSVHLLVTIVDIQQQHLSIRLGQNQLKQISKQNFQLSGFAENVILDKCQRFLLVDALGGDVIDE